MEDPTSLHLQEVTDQHFAWLLGETNATTPDNLTQPSGGVDDKAVLVIVRKITAALHAAGCRSHWLIVHGKEVVGLCGFKRPLDEKGEAEIGYGIASSRRGRGFAMRAVGLLIKEVSGGRAEVRRLVAETVVGNVASERVLERNGFARVGERVDGEDGEVVCWLRELAG